MAYPNSDQIQQAATTLGADPIYVYAFAADHQRVPTNATEIQAFIAMLRQFSLVPSGPVDAQYTAAFVQSHGVVPEGGQLDLWLQQQGIIGPQGQLQPGIVAAGQGYPPGGASVTPALNVPSNLVPGPTPGQAALSGVGTAASSTIQTATDWWRRNERTILLVGGLGGAFYFGIPQALLRSFGRRR